MGGAGGPNDVEGACIDCGSYLAGAPTLKRCPDCRAAERRAYHNRMYHEHVARRKAAQHWG